MHKVLPGYAGTWLRNCHTLKMLLQRGVGLTYLSFYLSFSPTAENVTLACCGGPVVESCGSNPACHALGLKGSCCPTTDGFGYLDCCTVLPDECMPSSKEDADPADCNLKSAEDYLAVQSYQESSAPLPSFFGWTLTLVTLVVWCAPSSH